MVDPLFDGGISEKPQLHQAAKFCRSGFVVNEGSRIAEPEPSSLVRSHENFLKE
jgi:hypothetical protein